MTPENKTVSVYIPDELRNRAEEAGINLSATLRDAVEEELARRAAIAETVSDGVEEHEVELDDGSIGVITGKRLGRSMDTEVEIFLTDDERVIVYNPERQQANELEDPEAELAEWLQSAHRDEAEVIAGAMRSLGYRPRVRL